MCWNWNKDGVKFRGKVLKRSPGVLLGRRVVVEDGKAKYTNHYNSDPELFPESDVIIADTGFTMKRIRFHEAPKVPDFLLHLQSMCVTSVSIAGFEDEWCSLCDGNTDIGEAQVYICCVCLMQWHSVCSKRVADEILTASESGPHQCRNTALKNSVLQLYHEGGISVESLLSPCTEGVGLRCQSF